MSENESRGAEFEALSLRVKMMQGDVERVGSGIAALAADTEEHHRQVMNALTGLMRAVEAVNERLDSMGAVPTPTGEEPDAREVDENGRPKKKTSQELLDEFLHGDKGGVIEYE